MDEVLLGDLDLFGTRSCSPTVAFDLCWLVGTDQKCHGKPADALDSAYVLQTGEGRYESSPEAALQQYLQSSLRMLLPWRCP